jgi:hypothetical protein
MSMSFQERNESLRNAEQAILNGISQPITTRDLVDQIMPQINDEYSIKAAIWFLIGRGHIEIRRENNCVLLAKV